MKITLFIGPVRPTMKSPLFTHQNIIGYFKISHRCPISTFQIAISIQIRYHFRIILCYPVEIIIDGKMSGIIKSSPHTPLTGTPVFISAIFPAAVLIPVFTAVNAIWIGIFLIRALQLAPHKIFFIILQRSNFFFIRINDILLTHIDWFTIGRIIRSAYHKLLPQIAQVVR